MTAASEITASVVLMGDRTSERGPATLRGARAMATRASGSLLLAAEPAGFADAPWEEDCRTAAPALADLRQAVSGIDRLALFGGHCAMAFASVPAVLARHPGAKLLWIDAHGDFHTPATTTSRFLGGMVLSGLAGRWTPPGILSGAAVEESAVVLAGASDLDPGERDLLAGSPVSVVSAADWSVDALEHALGDAPLFVHLDLDVIDAALLPAEYPSHEGLAPDALTRVLGEVVRERTLVGFEAGGLASEDGLDLVWPAVAVLLEAVGR